MIRKVLTFLKGITNDLGTAQSKVRRCTREIQREKRDRNTGPRGA